MLGESHAQLWSAMLTVVARAFKTPACHDGCEEEEQPSRQAPMRNAALRRARFVVPLPPSPAAPTQATPAKLSCPVLNPRRSRAFHAAPAPRQALAQAGCRVTPMQDRGSTVSRFARLLRVFDRLPTGSFGSSSHGPTGFAALRRVKQGRPASRRQRDSSNRVAFGHMRRRRQAALSPTREIPFLPSSCRKAGCGPEMP